MIRNGVQISPPQYRLCLKRCSLLIGDTRVSSLVVSVHVHLLGLSEGRPKMLVEVASRSPEFHESGLPGERIVKLAIEQKYFWCLSLANTARRARDRSR